MSKKVNRQIKMEYVMNRDEKREKKERECSIRKKDRDREEGKNEKKAMARKCGKVREGEKKN